MISLTREQYDATVLNMVYSMSQLLNIVPTDDTLELCKQDLLMSGKVRIIEPEAVKNEN